tara:strand:+ start:8986 stop:9447 length:462 start_codon:yes stop_codon:yes gene_type:complete
MQITVTGMGNKLKQKKELMTAAQFFADQLMDPRMVRNLMIDIEVSKKLDVMGECVDEDDARNSRFFTIGLKHQDDFEEMVKTLAHEMVHVKQHAKNELRSGIMVAARGGLKMTSKWMGQIWKPKGKEDHYYDSPWEIEAYGREVGLYAKWCAQ